MKLKTKQERERKQITKQGSDGHCIHDINMSLGWCDKAMDEPNVLPCAVSSSVMWDSKLNREWSGWELLELQGFDHEEQLGDWKSSELKDFAGEAFNGWTIAPVLISALAHLPDAQALFERSKLADAELRETKALGFGTDLADAGQFVSLAEYTKQFGYPGAGYNICSRDGILDVVVPPGASDDDGQDGEEGEGGECSESESKVEDSCVEDEAGEFEDFDP